MDDFVSYVISRLREASTWRGLVALATALGVSMSPEQMDSIVAAGLAIIGVIGTFFKDPGSLK